MHHTLRTALFAAVILLVGTRAGATPPANDECAAATVIAALPFNATLDTTEATTTLSDPVHGCTGLRNRHSVWYRFTAPSDGVLTVDTNGSGYNTVLSAYTGTCAGLTEIACSDRAADDEQVSFLVDSGASYLIEITGYEDADAGTLKLAAAVGVPPANDACASPRLIVTTPFSDTVDVGEATVGPDDPSTTCGETTATVWYAFTSPSTGTATADTIGSDFDTVLSVSTGDCDALADVTCNDDDPDDGPQSRVTFEAVADTTYLLTVGRFAATAGGNDLHFALTLSPGAPIATPSASATPHASTPTVTTTAAVTTTSTPTATPTPSPVATVSLAASATATSTPGAATASPTATEPGALTPTPTPSEPPTGTPIPTSTATASPPGALPTATPTLDPANARAREACQKAILKGSQVFVAKKLGHLGRCANGILKCIQTLADDAKRAKCVVAAATKCGSALAAVGAAEGTLRARIGGACGPPLGSNDLVAPDGLDFGTLASRCGGPLDTPAAVAACIIAGQACEVDRLFAAEQPRAAELLEFAAVPPEGRAVLACLPLHPGDGADLDLERSAGKAIVKCAGAIDKQAAALVRRELAAFSSCALRSFTCAQTKRNDPACTVKAAAACAKAFEKITKGRGTLVPAIAKACGEAALAYTLLRQPAGLDLVALQPECAAAGVPDVDTLGAYGGCLLQQHDCRTLTLLQLAMPRAAELLGTPPFPFPPAPCP